MNIGRLFVNIRALLYGKIVIAILYKIKTISTFRQKDTIILMKNGKNKIIIVLFIFRPYIIYFFFFIKNVLKANGNRVREKEKQNKILERYVKANLFIQKVYKSIKYIFKLPACE